MRSRRSSHEARPHIAEELGISPGELAGLHRSFEVVAEAQAQVDWGDEGKILAHNGIPKVQSFHMTLSYSHAPEWVCARPGYGDAVGAGAPSSTGAHTPLPEVVLMNFLFSY
ncbi:hypothetical protein [Streptomyces sp. NBC_01800]|uniref:hypothetical protein n=1 Tax=Streptomyces sp. NBC_01800 TaxID=2975945 RepID=UPI003FA3A3BC